MTELKFRAGGGRTMMILGGRMALAAALAIAVPMTAAAQDPRAKPGAAPPQVARPQVARPQAPQMSAPHVARPSAPNGPRPNFAAPQRHQAPAVVNRNVQQQQRHVQQERHIQRQQLRAERQRQLAPTAQAKQNAPSAQAKTNVPNAQARTNLQTQRQQQLNSRQQLRAERALQRREDRELRRLPSAQRAQRREEIRNTRQQRELNRQQLVQPNAAQQNVRAQRANRRNDVARVTPDAARRGRFAAPFAGQAARFNGRQGFAHLAAHRAWRQGHRAAFVAWYGPVFWPYAYSDVFDYTFWPAGYDDGYWAYAYDGFFDGVFWGEAGPPPDYGYASALPSTSAARASNAAVQELCTQPGTGITAWPLAEINSKVGLNPDQKQLLDQVRSSGQKAAAVFKASCPAENAFARTPPGRLQAMTLRLGATLEAVQTVRPAMVAFYDSLNDEQKERFNAIGPKQPKDSAEASQASVQDGKSCSEPKAGLTNLPIERIEDVVKPTDAQEDGLKQLEDATAKAVSIMQAACPEDTPITPPGRLEAMEKRLQAMVDAANTVKPALNDFYESLSGEQKARFNRIGGELAVN